MKLRIGHLSTHYHTCFVLMGTKWVGEMNLQPEWRLFPTGPEIIKAFGRDEIDISYVGLPPTMVGVAKGFQIKCIAGGHIEGTLLTAKKEFRSLSELGDIKKVLSQFKGRKIGTPSKGSIHDVIIRMLIKRFGLEKDILIKNYEWADLIVEAMLNGEIEAGCGTPSLAIAASRILDVKIVLPPHVIWPYNPSYGIVAKKELIENYPDVLEDFIGVHEKACNFIRSQPEKAAEITSKVIYLPGIVNKNFILQTYKISPKYCASLPKQYIDSTLAFVPVLQKHGYISRALTKTDVFHTELVKKVHPMKSHYNDPGKLGSDLDV